MIKPTPKEKARVAVEMLQQAIAEHVAGHPDGLRHFEIVKALDLHTDYKGNQKDYLSYSVIGLLLKTGGLTRVGNRYFTSRPGVQAASGPSS